MTALGFAGLKIMTAGTHGMMAPIVIRAIGTGVKGVFFQVKDPKNPPAEVQTIKKTLESANIKTGLAFNIDFPETDYALTVGVQ